MEFGEAIVWRVIVAVLLRLGATCRRYPEQERNYDRTGGCIWQHGYVDGLHLTLQYLHFDQNWTLPLGSGAWIEELPSQKTSYDRRGNVIQKVHYWPTGCWMVIEQSKLEGNECEPASSQK